MIHYTTPTGKQVLLPQVRKDAKNLEIKQDDEYSTYREYLSHSMGSTAGWADHSASVLGTFWLEGADYPDVSFNSWLQSIGYSLNEGMKGVVILID